MKRSVVVQLLGALMVVAALTVLAGVAWGVLLAGLVLIGVGVLAEAGML